MLERFAVENYRGFAGRVELNMSKVRSYAFHPECVEDGLARKCMVIGRNGCGKTNLGLALFDIVSVLTDLHSDAGLKDAFRFLNGDSDLPYATFSYVFRDGETVIEYEYSKESPDTIVSESLRADGKTLFSRNGDDCDLSGLAGIGAENLRVGFGDGPLSVLRYIANSTVQPEGSPIRAVMDFVKGMLYVRSDQGGDASIGLVAVAESVPDYIVRNGLVGEFQEVLRDTAGLDIVLDVIDPGCAPPMLAIRTKNKALDFERTASSGIRMLMRHYYWMKHLDGATLLFLDGFDSYYHYRLAEEVMQRISEKQGTQCIFTSHSTSLVSNRVMRPDCYLCLDSYGVESLADLTDREIRQGHNLEKLLRGGEFDRRAQNIIVIGKVRNQFVTSS